MNPIPNRSDDTINTSKLFNMLWGFVRPYRTQLIFACVTLVFAAAGVLSIGSGLRYLVDAGIAAGNPALLDQALVVLLFCVIVLAAASFGRYYYVSWIGEQVVADIRCAIFNKLVQMDIAFYERSRVGELLSRLTTDTTLLHSVVGSSLSIAIRNVLLMVGGLAMLIITSLELTTYVLLLVPAVVAPIIILGKRVRGLSKATQHKVAELNAHAEETFNAIRTVQALTLEAMEKQRFSDFVLRARDTAIDRIRLRGWLTAIVIALVFGAVTLVLWVGGHAVLENRITAGDLSAFVFYSVIVAGAVGAVSDVIGDIQRAAGAADRLSELLALQPAHDGAGDITMPPEKIESLRFEQVSFTYPARPETPVLHDISFEVQAGETVALVGPSGSGKTTLFQLLLRFYEPSSGQITLNAIPLKKLGIKSLRQMIGLVPQDPVLFTASVLDNIRAGHLEASEEEVIVALKAASAWDFISALPDGLHTHLGEKGLQLSGGQRQRLAIARAFIRNAPLLLLDEATSALDAENNRLVQEALSHLKQGRTTLVIAHSMATVQQADRIIVLDQGRIVRIGTHSELLATEPLYQRLAAQQLQA